VYDGDDGAATVDLTPQPVTHARVHVSVVPARADGPRVTTVSYHHGK